MQYRSVSALWANLSWGIIHPESTSTHPHSNNSADKFIAGKNGSTMKIKQNVTPTNYQCTMMEWEYLPLI